MSTFAPLIFMSSLADREGSCCICLEEFVEGDELVVLQCKHGMCCTITVICDFRLGFGCYLHVIQYHRCQFMQT